MDPPGFDKFRNYCKDFVQIQLNHLEIIDPSVHFDTFHLDCNQDRIKKQFFKLAKKYHPDKRSANPEKYNEIKEAYEFLKRSPGDLTQEIMPLFAVEGAKEQFIMDKKALETYLLFFKINERHIREFCYDESFVSLVYLVELRDIFTDENEALHNTFLETCRDVESRLKKVLFKLLEEEYFVRPRNTRRLFLNSRFNSMRGEFQEIQNILAELEMIMYNQLETLFISLDLGAFFHLVERINQLELKVYQGFITKQDAISMCHELAMLRDTLFTQDALDTLKIKLQGPGPEDASSCDRQQTSPNP
jgi:hypothetical protein